MKRRKIRKTCYIAALTIFFMYAVIILCYADIQNDSQDLHIEVNAGRISLDINNKPLIDILTGIQAKTGVDIRIIGIIRDRVSVKFSDLSLEQALNRLLGQVGYAALWEENNDNSTLKGLWICGRGEWFKTDRLPSTDLLNSNISELRADVSANFKHKVYTKNTRNEKTKEPIDKDTRDTNRHIQPRVKPHISSYHTSYHNIDNSSRSVNSNSSSEYVAGSNDAESENDSEDNGIDNANNSTITVTVENGKNVGAYEFRITYDPKLVQIENITPGSYLSDTGRNVSVLGPRIDNQKGEALFGVFSFGDEKGAFGEGVLAEITCSGSSRALPKLSKVQITDTKGNKLSLRPSIH